MTKNREFPFFNETIIYYGRNIKMLLVATLLLTAAPTKAGNILKTVISQISFAKKEFVDTIKIKVFDGAVIVPVEIDGKTRQFLFDTGGQSGVWYSPMESWLNPMDIDSVTVGDINKKVKKQVFYKSPPIKLGNLTIENYPLVHGEGMATYACGLFEGAFGFDLVAKGLSFKLDTKDSLLIVTDKKGFFVEEEKNNPFVKYKLIETSKPVIDVQSPFGTPIDGSFPTINNFVHITFFRIKM